MAELQPHPHLSLLPLEAQLALLFQASRKREERKRRKVESANPNKLSAVMAQDPELVLSFVISMPRAATTTVLADRGDGELAFGTAAFPWRYQQVAETRPQTLTTEDATLAPARV